MAQLTTLIVSRGLSLLFLLACTSPSVQGRPFTNSIPAVRSAAAPSMPAGYANLLFYDDFSDASEGGSPAVSKWQIDLGTSYPGGPARWGTNEVQTYTSSPDNLAISNGNLVIRPRQERPAGFSAPSSSAGGLALDDAIIRGGWTSARIETTRDHDFACAPGERLRMEARLRVGGAPAAAQQGIWPAFWSLGARFRDNYHSWPSIGEIDILETLNGENTAWHTVHCGLVRGGPCDETNGIGGSAPMARDEWHTVAVEIDRTNPGGDWRDETMTWFIDSRETFSLAGRRVNDEAAWASLAHAKRFLLLNVAVGGSFPDAIARTPTPTAGTEGGDGASMEVEYVAVYSTSLGSPFATVPKLPRGRDEDEVEIPEVEA